MTPLRGTNRMRSNQGRVVFGTISSGILRQPTDCYIVSLRGSIFRWAMCRMLKEVSMSLVNARKSSNLDVNAALYAICSTGRGRCWHCDRKLPPSEEAIQAGWNVQSVKGDRVASIILVCPKCQRKRAKAGQKQFLRNLTPSVYDAVQ